MPLTKERKKLNKLIQESDSDDSEHELSYYVNDRVKLMKEVLRTIKPKKIKAMAPICIKDLDMEEINSMLLEELLGISNKRLKYIFKGQNLEEDSSSSTNEDEPVDVISLDDVSDDEFIINLDDDKEDDPKHKKIKKEKNHTRVKREKEKTNKDKEPSSNKKKEVKSSKSDKNQVQTDLDSNKNLMSVLELLELQARARAIKSQILLENAKTQESLSADKQKTIEETLGSDDDIIIQTAKTEEIVITSSESEDDTKVKGNYVSVCEKNGNHQNEVGEPNKEESSSTSQLPCDNMNANSLDGTQDKSESDTTNQVKLTEIENNTENRTDLKKSTLNSESKAKTSNAELVSSNTEQLSPSSIHQRVSKSPESSINIPESEMNVESKQTKIQIIENLQLTSDCVIVNEKQTCEQKGGQCDAKKSEIPEDNETVVINLSDDEIDNIQ